MPANPSDYLNSAGMRDLLERMRERFAYVVIDSPPAYSLRRCPSAFDDGRCHAHRS
jgi:ATPases involved in chromosome partitioning